MRNAASAPDTAAARAYEDLLVPGLFMPSTQRALALAGVERGEAVIDVACGTGIGARLAAPCVGREGRIVGVDIDPGMLAIARSACADGTGASIDFVCASALELPLADQTFDVALCLQGLQFVGDPIAALTELRRVLKPGGRLVLTTWGPLASMPGHSTVYATLEAQGIDTTSPRRGFALDTPARLAALVHRSGYRDVETVQHEDDLLFESALAFVDGMLLGAPYTSRALACHPEEFRKACHAQACDRLKRFETPDGLRLPARINFVRAQR